MTPLIPALSGALVVAGVVGVVVGLQRVAPRPPAPARHAPWAVRHLTGMSRRTQISLLIGFVVGAAVALITGWIVALLLIPAAAAGLPTLVSAPPSTARIDKLEALEEWTRGLAGVLTAGVGLEQALTATLRSTPSAIRPEVRTLVARLRARMSTEKALRLFADELSDPTGDLVAVNLILGARRRGQGLASVLETLSESVASDVRARRAIEADRAKPRTTARWVTIITLGVLALLALTGDYVAPYGSPLGQLILGSLLSAYFALLVWMRRMAGGTISPRFMGEDVRARGAAT